MSETFVCPACASSIDTGGELARYPSGQATGSVPRPASVLYCATCGLGIAWPRISDAQLDDYYTQGEYWKTGGEPELLVPKLHPGHYALAEARWEFARDALAATGGDGLRVLDVGAGHGFFGMAVSRDAMVRLAGYTAVESDEHLRRSLERSWPHYAPRGELAVEADFAAVEGQFDLVVLSNILEHLNDPADLLGAIRGLLVPGGTVFADVPCRDERFKAEVFPHVQFFDCESLRALFEHVGFSVNRVAAFGHLPASSPLAAANAARWDVVLSTRLFGLRRLLPESASVAYYRAYYGARRSGVDGTWVRLTARSSEWA